VAYVQLAETAVADLHDLISSRKLPPDATNRVREALATLEQFPEAGAALGQRWAGYRAWRGPWDWMIHVYAYDARLDVLTVTTIQDSRTSSAPMSL
jgi:hypothetical protein